MVRSQGFASVLSLREIPKSQPTVIRITSEDHRRRNNVMAPFAGNSPRRFISNGLARLVDKRNELIRWYITRRHRGCAPMTVARRSRSSGGSTVLRFAVANLLGASGAFFVTFVRWSRLCRTKPARPRRALSAEIQSDVTTGQDAEDDSD